jgi:hypothetical protein
MSDFNNKVIEEADEALETSLMMSHIKKKDEENILSELSIVDREVNKIVNRIRSIKES